MLKVLRQCQKHNDKPTEFRDISINSICRFKDCFWLFTYLSVSCDHVMFKCYTVLWRNVSLLNRDLPIAWNVHHSAWVNMGEWWDRFLAYEMGYMGMDEGDIRWSKAWRGVSGVGRWLHPVLRVIRSRPLTLLWNTQSLGLNLMSFRNLFQNVAPVWHSFEQEWSWSGAH